MADIFLADTKLNVSPYYLRPGGPYGGSCLPKDLSGMLALARDAGLSVPVLAGARESNAPTLLGWRRRCGPGWRRPGRSCSQACRSSAGTDDLRNSPLLDLAEILVEDGTISRSTIPTSTLAADRRQLPSRPSTRPRSWTG